MTHVFLQGGVGGLVASVAAFSRQYWARHAARVLLIGSKGVTGPEILATIMAGQNHA